MATNAGTTAALGKERVVSKQEMVEALERDQAFLSNYVQLGQDVNSSLRAAQKAAEDSGRGELYKTWTVPAKIEQTLSGALRLGEELQELRRAHITLQEAHSQLRCEHAALQARATNQTTQLTSGSLAPLARLPSRESIRSHQSSLPSRESFSTRLPSRESKDYQVRGMLQKLTHFCEPLEHQPIPNVSPPPSALESFRAQFPAPPLLESPQKQRRSESATSLPSGSIASGAVCAPGIVTPAPAVTLSGSNSAASLRHLPTAGRMTLTSSTPMTDVDRIPARRPGTSERAAVRDALSELLAGAGSNQRRLYCQDSTFSARCRSH